MYEHLGVELGEAISKTVLTVVSPFTYLKVGYPTSRIEIDLDWEEYCQGFNTENFTFEERSGYTPAEISERALVKQLANYEAPINLEAIRSFDVVECWLGRILEEHIGRCRVLSYREALDGISDEFGTLEPLNLKASPGFGLSNKHHDKRGWVEYDPVLLKRLCKLAWNLMKRGYTVMHLLKASEKDEKRDIPRVMEYKTRLFMAACMIDTINYRRLVGDFVRRFMKAGTTFSFFSAAGMGIYNGEWDRFIRYMTGDLAIQRMAPLDVGRWDKLFPHLFHYLNGRQYASCYPAENTPMIMRRAASVAYSPFVLAIIGAVVLRPRDEPSGVDTTIVDNGMGMERQLLSAWLLTDGDATLPDGGTSLERFRRFVRHKVIGDDLLMLFSPGSPLNAEHVIRYYDQWGWDLSYPPGCQGYINDSYFAGRRSVLAQVGDLNIFLPVIDRDRILAVNEFRKGKPDPLKRLMRAYAAAELAFPLLFEEDEYLFAVLYDYYMFLKRRAIMQDLNKDLQAAGEGLPTYADMWLNYTGHPCPTSEIHGLIDQQRKLARERGGSHG